VRNDRGEGRLRRYLLGAATGDECDAIERAYFEHADALDAVSAAEDHLIDDYLSGSLEREEREQFDRHYLATPLHRRRVAVARAIRNAAAVAPSTERRHSRTNWWRAGGIAAASMILVAGAAWVVTPRRESMNAALDRAAAPAAPSIAHPAASAAGEPDGSAGHVPSSVPSPGLPTALEVTIAPILIRGADNPASLTIKEGTDIVRLLLQVNMDERDLGRGVAVVRTVEGREIWRGRAEDPRLGLAHVTIRASLLAPADYIVELRGTDAAGKHVEWHRYYLRIRAP